MLTTFTSLFFIALAAVLAPIVADFIPRIRVPVVVLEIALGIIIGPQVLGLAHYDAIVETFSEFGLAFLFFLAGFEVDLHRIRGRPLNLAVVTWLVSLGVALAIGTVLVFAGLQAPILFVALAMATTTLGTLVPILEDAGALHSSLGAFTLAAGSVGEFAPIVAMALLLDESRGVPLRALAINAFILGVLAVILLGRRWHPARLSRMVKQTIHSSAQLAVRMSLLVLAFLIFLAERFGLDMVLGAFAAGMVVQQVVATSAQAHHEPEANGQAPQPDYVQMLRSKYEGIGFGFVIPAFFVTVGIEFDLRGLFTSVTSVLLVPLFLILFLVVRGLPTLLLYRNVLPPSGAHALALFCATQLPLVIAITQLGVADGKMSPVVAAGMVGAGMLSVFLFPTLALAGVPAVATTPTDSLPSGQQNALDEEQMTYT